MSLTITPFTGGITVVNPSASLVSTSNYLYSLCGMYGLTAQGILNGAVGGGTVGMGSNVEFIKSPIRITSADFASATEWNGQNSINQEIKSTYTLQLFGNSFSNNYLEAGVDWVRTLQGVKILIPDFDATQNSYIIYVDISQ